MYNSATAVTLEDYKILKIIGKSDSGKVYLAQHKESKEYYAMKCLQKD